MKKKPAKPTPRGLEVLRILAAAWERNTRTCWLPRGIVFFPGRDASTGEALRRHGWAMKTRWGFQITAAGRAAVKRAEGR